MIQRIQTVFWLFAGIAIGLIFFFPMAMLTGESLDAHLWLKGYVESGSNDVLYSTWPLTVLSYLILLLTIFIIFQYKRRVLQLRLTIYNILLIIGLCGLAVFYSLSGAQELNGEIELSYFSIMPVIAIILNLLAWRGVRRDYLLLKAVDRIR
jgi:hypothetical protein